MGPPLDMLCMVSVFVVTFLFATTFDIDLLKFIILQYMIFSLQSNWAEEVEDIGDISALREKLPTAPKASRQMYDISQLPPNGPWKAKLSNLPFSVKEEEIIK